MILDFLQILLPNRSTMKDIVVMQIDQSAPTGDVPRHQNISSDTFVSRLSTADRAARRESMSSKAEG